VDPRGPRGGAQGAGDWISRDIAGEPVIVTKGEDGEIRAMSRVCRHRFMDLLDGEPKRCGHAEKLTCPYHLWSYNLDGKFVAAPHMNRSTLFEQEKDGYALPTFALHIWQGVVVAVMRTTTSGDVSRSRRSMRAVRRGPWRGSGLTRRRLQPPGRPSSRGACR
jgi:phenylpropionate dioxygenase-like ring-hydroxylating dioxygenase large terminal subunit